MAKVIMIQGTMSNVGKSLLTAGLCRVFVQDGYKTAPFKSQNMALNSYITDDGLEIGRAQAMQAEAAKTAAVTDMNPILLKPTSDMGSQVILNGEVLGNMPAREYFGYKKKLIPEVLNAYERLAGEYDIIVIEGAGSPAEINLKKDDLVNMGLADMVDAPVLLVGDIDRGGVFAQLIGTKLLLEPKEQERIKGMVVNKFRGDLSIFKDGERMLEEKSKVPLVGVVPYLDINLEDEDSLSRRFCNSDAIKAIDIAIVRLPRISNFTDFAPLENREGISVRYVSSAGELKNPDMIFIPGTKNTIDDLKWMRENGLESAILKKSDSGTVIFGICGGYQMMGRFIRDPFGVEQGGEIQGMGLLPVETVFEQEKTRTRVRGCFGQVEGVLKGLSGQMVGGYEIHMGGSRKGSGNPFIKISEGSHKEYDGCFKGNCYGTYLHGVLDFEETVLTILEALAKAKGIQIELMQRQDYKEYKEIQYDKLADHLRKHLDIEKIYEIMEGRE